MSKDVDEDLLAVAGTLLNLLAQHGWCLGTAESLTGGNGRRSHHCCAGSVGVIHGRRDQLHGPGEDSAVGSTGRIAGGAWRCQRRGGGSYGSGLQGEAERAGRACDDRSSRTDIGRQRYACWDRVRSLRDATGVQSGATHAGWGPTPHPRRIDTCSSCGWPSGS